MSNITAPMIDAARSPYDLRTQNSGAHPEFRLWFGAGADDYHEGINFDRMRSERAERARVIMRKHGVATLLITGAENVRYATGFSWSEFQSQASYALFFVDYDPVVFAHAGSYQQMPDQAPWLSNWRIGRSWFSGVAGPAATLEEARLFAGEIAEELTKRGLNSEKLGIIGFDHYATAALDQAGLKWFHADELLLEASQVKTIDEIYCLKHVAAICSVGFETARREARPGMLQSVLTKTVRSALTHTEADAVGAKVLSGPLSFERGLSGGDRVIEAGDIFYLLTCGTSFMGYTACLYRTFSVGFEPKVDYERWYDELLKRIDLMVGAVKPGASTADVAQHFPPASKWGYKDEAEVLSVELGHGIGLVNLGSRHVHYNWPVINRQWSLNHPQELEPGMVLAIESLEGTHREAGVRLEDMVVVTDTGVALLDAYPREKILVTGC